MIFPVLALAVLTAFFILIPSTLHAQEREKIGLLNRLFGQREVQRVEPAPRIEQPAAPRPRKRRPARAPVEGVDVAPQAAAVTKRPDARTVLVVGDFLAGGLAEGLTTAFSENAGLRISDRSSGSSGFVRLDFYNWAEEIDRLITAERPVAVIVMIGANDRQQMSIGGVKEAVRSESWNREYAKRAGDLARAVAARKVPLLWIGAPPFKSSRMMLDMLAFNEVYRAAVTGAGGEYVDIWDGFVDQNGAYIANGPDLNGQPARLRAGDGINLARPGKRKVAFYAEKPLYKILGENPGAQGSAVAVAVRPAYRMFGPFGPSDAQEPADLDVPVDPNEVGPVDPARPVALRTPGLDGGTELLGALAGVRTEPQTSAERLVVEGFAMAPPVGRADQSAWPQYASAAASARTVNVDNTRNKAAVPSAPVLAAIDRAGIRPVRSNVLAEPQPPMPPRAAPEIVEDRYEEISPAQAAPDVAAPDSPMATPPTLDRDLVPNYAAGDPLDRSPSRGAPERAFKRPTSIGPEPNRAPTALPQPAVEEAVPAEEISTAAAPADGTAPVEASSPAQAAEANAAPATPDTAPARAPAPSVLQADTVTGGDTAPVRIVPRKAEAEPVTAAAAAKEAPSEVPETPTAPVVLAPNTAVETKVDTAAVRGAPADLDAVDAETPMRLVPSVLPVEGEIPAANPVPAEPAPVAQPATPVAPAAPATNATAPAGEPAISEPAQTATPAEATPQAPAAPTVLPENAAKPAPVAPGRRADADEAEPDEVDGEDVSSIRSTSASSAVPPTSTRNQEPERRRRS